MYMMYPTQFYLLHLPSKIIWETNSETHDDPGVLNMVPARRGDVYEVNVQCSCCLYRGPRKTWRLEPMNMPLKLGTHGRQRPCKSWEGADMSDL